MTRVPLPDEALFATLTEKQSEMLALLAEGLTGKEIAAHLEISYSAVSQRIENLRRKFGGITKNELGRLYREYQVVDGDSGWIKYTGPKNGLHEPIFSAEKGFGNQSPGGLEFSDSYVIDAATPWSAPYEKRLVPEVLDGENAVLARWVYVVGAALGMAILLLVLLAVSTSIGELV